MKTMKFFTYSVFIMFLGIAISSCTGPDGPAGADGADGVDGADGADGNANVIYSDWVAYEVASWSDVINEFSLEYRQYPVNVSELSQDIVDKGVVLCFTKFPSVLNTVFSHPFYHHITSTTTLQQLSQTIDLNTINMRMMNQDGSGNPGVISSGYYRYVLVEGTTQIGSRNANPQQAILDELDAAGVDINDYLEICDYYGINP
jgi:hypothetical protein